MPDSNTTTPQWNPVQAFRQQWPNANLSDQQILNNLQDPAKFRSAFPQYTGVTDDMVRTKMSAYLPQTRERATAPTPPPDVSAQPNAILRFMGNFGAAQGLPTGEGSQTSDLYKGPLYAIEHP